jgi:hypothetical protein
MEERNQIEDDSSIDRAQMRLASFRVVPENWPNVNASEILCRDSMGVIV